MSDDDRKQANTQMKEIWGEFAPAVRGSMKRVLDYIFALNTGGAALCVTYLATKEGNDHIKTGMRYFIAGIALIVIRGAWDYYSCESDLRRLRSDIRGFYRDKLDWADYLKNREKEGEQNWIGHTLGWFSAGACIMGTWVALGGLL